MQSHVILIPELIAVMLNIYLPLPVFLINRRTMSANEEILAKANQYMDKIKRLLENLKDEKDDESNTSKMSKIHEYSKKGKK